MVANPSRVIATVTASVLLAVPALAGDAGRLKIEGIAVLRAATPLESYTGQASSPCRIEAEWSKQTVPYDIAQKVFGLKLKADLAAGSPVPDSYAILSSVEPDPARLCSKDEIGRQLNAAQMVLPSGANFSYHVASYTFPVFDTTFTKAVVVWTTLYSSRRVGWDQGRLGGIDFTVTALTFVKHRKRWILVAREVMGQT